jgi:hypothetical protein
VEGFLSGGKLVFSTDVPAGLIIKSASNSIIIRNYLEYLRMSPARAMQPILKWPSKTV